jgi:hypothetical protein
MRVMKNNAAFSYDQRFLGVFAMYNISKIF